MQIISLYSKYWTSIFDGYVFSLHDLFGAAIILRIQIIFLKEFVKIRPVVAGILGGFADIPFCHPEKIFQIFLDELIFGLSERNLFWGRQ